jgi:hypothetical protein
MFLKTVEMIIMFFFLSLLLRWNTLIDLTVESLYSHWDSFNTWKLFVFLITNFNNFPKIRINTYVYICVITYITYIYYIIITTTIENSMEAPHKTKNKSALWSSNTTDS